MPEAALTRVLVTGSRGWTDEARIRAAFAAVEERTPRPWILVVGDARGADQLARKEAALRGWETEMWIADWDRYGRRAGFRRNAEMVERGADLALAFWDGQSRGTAHAMQLCRAKGIFLEVFEVDDVSRS
jgi:hypothetical protein